MKTVKTKGGKSKRKTVKQIPFRHTDTDTVDTNRFQKIADRLQHFSPDIIQNDFNLLKSMNCSKVKKTNDRCRIGNKVVDAFTLTERLHTKGNQNINFYEFWDKRKHYTKKRYLKNILRFYKNRNIDEIRKYKYIYNLCFSSISIFRPIMAMELYCRVKARRILDFTMGWGGRLVGACALGMEAYYGIDLNPHLKTPYTGLVKFLESQPDHKTKIELQFQNALHVHYQDMDYDTVFTSPPYYTIEVYRRGENQENPYKTNEDWDEHFYKPLFQKTYQYLKKGGHYCLNVSNEIYEKNCVPLWGKCHRSIKLKKGERNPGKDNYEENIYIWKKE